MGFEVEVKFRVVNRDDLIHRLEERHATPTDPVEHEDVYFAHPSRDFAQTGEAFRIRGEGETNRITYKGPKWGGPTKTREEIELEFLAGLDHRGDLRLIFERLGFTVVATVRKERTSYQLDVQGRVMTVVLDRAAMLGDFAEVETLVDHEGDLPQGQGVVLALARDLGLSEVEERSYLRMILEKTGQLPRNPTGQT